MEEIDGQEMPKQEEEGMIITRKIEIACRNKDQYPLLQDYLKQCRLMANKAMTNYYILWQEMLETKPKNQTQKDYFRKKHGCSFQNTGYRYLGRCFGGMPSYLRRDVANRVYQDFRADLKNGLLKGERSLRNYRTGHLPLHNKDIQLCKEETSSDYLLRWRMGIEFVLLFGRDRSGNRIIADRLIEGTYRVSGSQIYKDWRKKKWFVLLCVEIPQQDNNLDETAVVGVDLGLSTPAVCALSNGMARAYIGSSNLLKRFEMQKKQRSRQREFIPATNKHGRQKVVKAIYAMKDKERRFVHSFNHVISKKIIQFALKHKAAVIRMEDLSGYNGDETVLRNWSYYELQSMIEYKAEKEKIRVEKIPACYTSRACSQCGFIAEENRKTQARFECVKCGFKANADYNAALNIARGGVKIPEENQENFGENE